MPCPVKKVRQPVQCRAFLGLLPPPDAQDIQEQEAISYEQERYSLLTFAWHIILVHPGPTISLLLSPKSFSCLIKMHLIFLDFVLSVARREVSDPDHFFPFKTWWTNLRDISFSAFQMMIWKIKKPYLCQKYLNFFTSKASSVIRVRLRSFKSIWFCHLWYL